jgi:hypothetical protein
MCNILPPDGPHDTAAVTATSFGWIMEQPPGLILPTTQAGQAWKASPASADRVRQGKNFWTWLAAIRDGADHQPLDVVYLPHIHGGSCSTASFRGVPACPTANRYVREGGRSC